MLFGKYFRQYYLKYAAYFFTGVFILICINWLQLEIPEYVKNITKIFQETTNITNDKSKIYDNIKSIIILVFIIAISRVGWRFALFASSRQIQEDIRNDLFLHITKQSQEFYATNKVGKLMSYFTQDLEQIRQSYAFALLYFIDIVFLGGLTLFKIFQRSWFVGISSIIPLILIGVFGFYFEKRQTKEFKTAMDSFEKMNEFAQESFSGNYVVKAFDRNDSEAKIFMEKARNYKADLIKFVKTLFRNNIIFGFIRNLILVTVIISVSISVTNPFGNIPKLEPSDLILMVLYITTLIWPINAVSALINVNSRAKASSKRILDFLNTEVKVKDRKDLENINLDAIKGKIEFRNLSFKYPDEISERQALHNVSFTIKPGEMVGILGRTGSGKTTLVDLLLRLYNLDKNQLFIDDHDIMDLRLKQVRELISYVPQDNFLFTDTITNNIGFSYPYSNIKLVENSSKIASIYSNIIEFQDNFHTQLGERGVTLSGGQKQRISIARALIRDSKILILDDSVSALDTKTETSIIKNLKENRLNKTTIFITHRISTMEKMDKVILIDEGRILQVGSHEELLKTNELYKNLYFLQQLEKEID